MSAVIKSQVLSRCDEGDASGGFEQQRHALAAAGAGGDDGALQSLAPELQQRRKRTAHAGRRQRVAEGDGAAIDVELVDIEVQRGVGISRTRT